ncbi:hypothetical protein O181_015044 [Austropuccinia psidii MF-1]|uniref:Uncharacterized protein n=1 Tax=Austropuccinia psidii MF-1 TaxID=1389203 RepID=A0A9Q3GQG0_9BASI|nr:hypothetical protein [Austropuccinia psidii MF-1]
MEIQEARDEHKFILSEEELPWKGYTNWKPLKNSDPVDNNDNNSRKNSECSNQHVKWLEDINTPKQNKLYKIKYESGKMKKKAKEEKEYFLDYSE